ncbi:MAG: CRISPR-associated protein Cas4, partial [candidate division WOR-3 bacterium]|nr:CRISPR-associated protein Cas4 [candidate division WOR-3 bacterium]
MTEDLEQDAVNFDTEQTPMITTSDVLEYLFCPRFTYYMNCLKIPQNEQLRYLVLKGREIHQNRAKENRDYLRKKIACIKKEINIYLASPRIRVRGVVDEVLTLADGTMAPLDYKYTKYREYLFRTHKYQSVIYAMLIQETYQKPVVRGYICYLRDGALLKEIVYKPQDFAYISEVIDEIFRIIQKGCYPA